MSGHEIQHLYSRSKGGYLVYHHTEVVEIESQEDKTSIIHLEVLPEPLPTRDDVFDSLLNSKVWDGDGKFNGVLPDWLFLA